MNDFQDYLKSMVEEKPVAPAPALDDSNEDLGGSDDVPATSSTTEFDFIDHLKTALSKNTKKRIWGDW